jgi:GDP/UDP-N,N'-diacetylbacillosamine 2-epimerase (hydrolysing)
MNVAFFGNWGLANLVLKKLLANPNIKVAFVVSQFDEARNDRFYNCVYRTSIKNGLKVYSHIQDVPNQVLLNCSFGLSVSFSQIFKKTFLSKLAIFNVHPSILPFYRGPSPIQWQIKDGKTEIGVTIHEIDERIDEGRVYAQSSFSIDYKRSFNETLDLINDKIATWVSEKIDKPSEELFSQLAPLEKGKVYFHRINIPKVKRSNSLSVLREYLNRKRILIFSGNRAEFGILLPLLAKLSELYYVDLVLSGSHVKKPWMTKEEVYDSINQLGLSVNIVEVPIKVSADYYKSNFNENFNFAIDLYKKYQKTYPIDLVLILGDRVETYAFATGSFFSKVPICHLFGGDVSNVPYFDTNVRHAITKLSSLHFASNTDSYKNLLRMGEEEWRCNMMGNISLDNYRNNNYSKKSELLSKYKLKEDILIITTYHPSQFLNTSENFMNFQRLYRALESLLIPTIITYPNNDEGHQLITEFLNNHNDKSGQIKVFQSLGIKDYLGFLLELDCIVVGNSSSGLYETAYSGTPAINLGDRQTDRPRGRNVQDVNFEEFDDVFVSMIRNIISNYDEIKLENLRDKYFFGKGESVQVVLENIHKFLSMDKQVQLFKKFI